MTLRDIGLAAHDGDDAELADLGLTGTDDPVVTLGRLGRADIERRRFITTAAYSVAAAAMPLGLADEYAERTAAATSGRRAGAADVQAVHDMVRMFVAIDERHGGRHGRSTVVQYLTTDVAEMCRAVFHTGEQHRRMLSTAASLAHLAGWKAYDAGEHGLAQRYYLQAYRLTREAENEPHQAYVMRILAHHGMDNGRPEHTLALAEAALSRAHGKVDPATESLFVICRARALAEADKRAAALSEADRARDMAAHGAADAVEGWAAMWGHPSATVASHTAKIMKSVGDHAGAERHHAAARRRYGSDNHLRISALSAAAEGEAQCAQGQVELACETWTRALDAMTGIRSSRTTKAVAGMRSSLTTFRARGARPAQELDERARQWLRERA